MKIHIKSYAGGRCYSWALALVKTCGEEGKGIGLMGLWPYSNWGHLVLLPSSRQNPFPEGPEEVRRLGTNGKPCPQRMLVPGAG